MGKLIAIIDDEPDIQELVSLHLSRAGFETQTFGDAKDFFRFLDSNKPDLVILDLMLPDADGLDVCKHLRKSDAYSQIPIIMLTAKGEETDRILGLELGADDYVTKPFSPRELVARVKAVLRREIKLEVGEMQNIAGIISIDPGKHEVKLKGEVIDLTTTEFRILQLLASKKGWVFSRDQILDYLWGQEKAVLDRTIDVHIKHLREKLGEAGYLIKNVRSVGYKLEE
ncbi:MAG: response regulator [Candidatus Aminicenantes bacterium]|jgi:two-component system phosphate regulon response regulator PhoB/two-component system alkaline phosphatase synthesis response regulator PhoP